MAYKRKVSVYQQNREQQVKSYTKLTPFFFSKNMDSNHKNIAKSHKIEDFCNTIYAVKNIHA
jgi:hypothetical protein